MNIDDLTIGQAKELVKQFGGENNEPESYLLGQYVIVRSRESGVHAGFLTQRHNRLVVLKESRRLWYWKAKMEHTLSAVALHGLGDGSKIAGVLPVVEVLDACEIIPVSKSAMVSIQEFASHDPS